jgi:hypothetical protein
MPEIFLSYRRADATDSAGRLFNKLSERFGHEQVFRDLESIEAGENFEQSIQDAIGTAGAVLVVIGPRWLALQGEDGKRRLDDPLDYVRREIELALSLDTTVIPVLVEGAPLPAAASLPRAVDSLTKRNAIALSNERWDADVEVLLQQLERSGIAPVERSEPLQAAGPRGIYSAVKAMLADYALSFYMLLRRPQRFLRRAASAKVVDLARAFVFFTLTTVIAIALVLSSYTPTEGVIFFALAILAAGLVTTLVLSLPLWGAWRLVGARRHYARTLIILLHETAILQLALLIVVWLLLVAMDMQSSNIVSDTMQEARQAGRSAGAGLQIAVSTLMPLVDSAEVRVALFIITFVAIGSSVWLFFSWGAYRQALGLSRIRSAAAFTAFIAITGFIALLLGAIIAL